jgi:hypothetical protein
MATLMKIRADNTQKMAKKLGMQNGCLHPLGGRLTIMLPYNTEKTMQNSVLPMANMGHFVHEAFPYSFESEFYKQGPINNVPVTRMTGGWHANLLQNGTAHRAITHAGGTYEMMAKSKSVPFGQPSAALLFTVDADGKQISFEDHTKILDYNTMDYTWNSNIFIIYLGDQSKIKEAEKNGSLSYYIHDLEALRSSSIEDLTLTESTGPNLGRIFHEGRSYLPPEGLSREPVIYFPWAKGGVSESRIKVKIFFGKNLHRFRRYVLAIMATYRMAKMCGLMGPPEPMLKSVYSKLYLLNIYSRYDFMAPLHLTSIGVTHRAAAVKEAVNWVNIVIQFIYANLCMDDHFYITHFRPLFAEYYRCVQGPMIAHKYKTTYSDIWIGDGLVWAKKDAGGYEVMPEWESALSSDESVDVKLFQINNLTVNNIVNDMSLRQSIMDAHASVSARVTNATYGDIIIYRADHLSECLQNGVRMFQRPNWTLVYESLDKTHFNHQLNWDWPRNNCDKPRYWDYTINWGEKQEKQRLLLKQCLREMMKMYKIFGSFSPGKTTYEMCARIGKRVRYKRYWNMFRNTIPAMMDDHWRIVRDEHDRIVPRYDAFEVPTLSWPL